MLRRSFGNGGVVSTRMWAATAISNVERVGVVADEE